MDATEKKLEEFIAKTLKLPGDPVAVFELVQMTDGEIQRAVMPFYVESRNPDASLLAREILRTAGDHCDGHSLPQRYAVLAIRKNSKSFFAQHPLMLRPSPTAGNSAGGVTEPPTERGLISQCMRHTEAAYSAMINLSQVVATMHERRANQAEAYFNQAMAVQERYAAVQAEQEDRIAQREEAERQADHDRYIERTAFEELRPLVRQIGPHAVRKFVESFGLNGAPPKASKPPAKPNQAPDAAEEGKEAKAGAEAAEENENRGEPIDAKQVLRDALNEITAEEADKLEEILGKEKVHRIINAALKAST